MSSEEDTTSLPHVNAEELHKRHRRTPKHLEDYILAYHHRGPPLSSYPEHEEQRGAAAAADSGQADTGFQPGTSRALHSPSPGDPLSTMSLRQLMDSISRSEREERAEIAQVTNKLRQYEHRQRRRQELLQHITSYLHEEEENEEDHNAKGATTPLMQLPSPIRTPSHINYPRHSPSTEKQVQNKESHAERHTPADVILTLEREAELRDYTPDVVIKGTKSAFTPIHPSSPYHPILSYPSISSGSVTPTSAPQQLIKPVPLQPRVTEPYCGEEEFASNHLPYKHTASYHGQVALNSTSPPIYSLPQYVPMPTSAVLSQSLPSGPVVTNTTPAVQARLPTTQAAAPHNFSLQPRSIYGVPKPKIPDFTSDSEREFANLKLALNNLLEPYPELTEKYRYHVLLEHLKLPEAQMIGQSCRHDPFPYTAAMYALQLQYGQPHQLAQSEIAAILTTPDVRSGDARTFQSFALRVHLLVSMLLSLEGPQGMELNCCSHVDRLLGKLPKYHRDGFIEYLQLQGKLNTTSLNPYNLQDLNGWLQGKAQQQRLSNRLVQRYQHEKPANDGRERIPFKGKGQSIAVYHGVEPIQPNTRSKPTSASGKKSFNVNCLFCDSKEHYISRCPSIKVQSTAELHRWITDGKRCWKCARAHAPESCNLKKPCSDCGDIHLQVLHSVAQGRSTDLQARTLESRVYLTPSMTSSKVLLKVVPVLLHNNSNSVETFAVLDDGAQRTMILPTAVQQLRLNGESETLALRTVRTDLTHLQGLKVNFEISPKGNPQKRFKVQGAFTAADLDLVEQTYPVQMLQKRHSHLRGIPLKSFYKARPLVLLGSDHVHLITATEPTRRGFNGGLIAIHTALGWALQGPERCEPKSTSVTQCLFTSFASSDDLLYRNVER